SFDRMARLLAGQPAPALVASDEIYERGPLPPRTRPRQEVQPLEALRVDGLTYRHTGSGGGIVDASFEVRAGSFTVVTGRIGSGKSTLLRAMLGLVPAEGRITWNGLEVVHPALFLAPPRTAYTPQVPHLFSDTLEDNI